MNEEQAMNDIVLKAGGEGGSIALYGLPSNSGWLFSLDVMAADLRSGVVPPDMKESVVDSWPKALALLDHYPWPRLTPVLIHPDFREQILSALNSRSDIGGPEFGPVSGRWKELCMEARSSDMAQYQTREAVHSSDGWLYGLVDQPTSEEDREYLRAEMLKAGLSEDDIKDMF